MKLTKKLIVSAFAGALTLGVVGSISGTVAWYQFSNKSTVQLIGLSSGKDRYLKLAIADVMPAATSSDWKSDLFTKDVETYLASVHPSGTPLLEYEPGTPSVAGFTKDTAWTAATKMRPNPDYQNFNINDWGTLGAHRYVELPVWVGYLEKDSTTTKLVSREIGVSDVTIENIAVSGKLDISSAVRVHIQNEDALTAESALFANVAETTTHAKLDIGGPAGLDRDGAFPEVFHDEVTGHDYLVESGTEKEYGEYNESNEIVNSKQTSYDLATPATKTAIMNTKTSNGDEIEINGGLNYGKTEENKAMKFTVRIWLEGWQTLTDGGESPTISAIWDEMKYDLAKFAVKFTFVAGTTRV